VQTPKAQPTGVDRRCGDIRLAASRSASRELSAIIVSAGLALPWVGSALPSVMNRFDTSQQRWSLSTTLFSGDVAIRQLVIHARVVQAVQKVDRAGP
jgi:hypothetical protein